MKTNTKALALTLLATTIIATGASFASNTTSTGVVNTLKQMTGMTTEKKAQLGTMETNMAERNDWGMGGKGHKGKGGRGMEGEMMGGGFGGGPGMEELTDEEKTTLETMTDDEKKAFFDAKRTQNEVKMEARETVIDKLLNGEALTADEEKIKEEIKLQRAEMKAKRTQMKEIRTLMEKQKAGTTLTADEQAKIDAFKAKMPEQKGKGFGKKW